MLTKQKYIPDPEAFIAETPLTPALQAVKAERDKEICDVIAGKSDKMLVVVGPCSAHDSAATLEYISRLGSTGISVLLIEGGGELAASAIAANAVDFVEFHMSAIIPHLR